MFDISRGGPRQAGATGIIGTVTTHLFFSPLHQLHSTPSTPEKLQVSRNWLKAKYDLHSYMLKGNLTPDIHLTTLLLSNSNSLALSRGL